MMRRGAGAPAQAGFTLLEVLVSITVLGILLASLGAAVGFSARAWRAHGAALDRVGDLDAVDRILRELITDMEPGDEVSGAMPITGQAHVLSFRTRLPDGVGAVPGRDVDVGLGVDAGHRLVLRSWPLYRSLAGAPPVTETLLLPGVRKLDLEYWDAERGEWRTEWTAGELPGLVRVRITMLNNAPGNWPDIVAAPRRQREQA